MKACSTIDFRHRTGPYGKN